MWHGCASSRVIFNRWHRASPRRRRAVAGSGVLVVAIDMTLAPEAPYPASVQDANYGVRWLKSRAAEWNGDAARLGVLGSSSGGHVAQLLALRPRYGAYNTIPLPAAPAVDATVAYVATRSPISDTWARYQQAERMQRDQNIQIEKLALFIRYFLTVSTPVPEAHQDAARAQGKARFEQFVEQLGRHLLRGRSLVRDVVEELHPDPMRMDDAAALAETHERTAERAS